MPELGIMFGIGSAASWGAADFLGGMAARRSGAIAVAGGATVVGWIALLALLAIVRPPLPTPGAIGLAAVAGIAGGLGLVALYRGLSLGSMGLLAALSGVGSVLLPLVVGAWLSHDVIGAWQWVGMTAALAAAAAASGATLRGVSSRALVMALLAAIGFGLWYVMLDQAATEGHELWALVASRGSSSVVVGWLAIWRGGIASLRSTWRLVVGAGLLDLGATVGSCWHGARCRSESRPRCPACIRSPRCSSRASWLARPCPGWAWLRSRWRRSGLC